jgi:integrase
MEKRGYRTGTIYQRSSDGRWIASLPDGHGGRARYVTGKTREDVERRLAEATSSPSRRRNQGETVAAYLRRWFEGARRDLRPRTADGYEQLLEGHVIPAVGRLRLAELSPADVDRMIRDMLVTGYSPQTARHAHKVLRVALRQAERWGDVQRNAAALVKAPRVIRRPIEGMTADEARAFLAGSAEHEHHALYVLALSTGMRRGELLALRWSDLDLKGATVRVSGTLRAAPGGRYERDEPKTSQSRRVLPLTRESVAALRDHLKRANSTDYVFARPDGRPWPPAEVTRTFQAELVRQGLRSIRFHDLRHTAAQLVLDRLGGDIRAVSSMLGHTTISTTVDIYGGAADDARRRFREAMDGVLEGHG